MRFFIKIEKASDGTEIPRECFEQRNDERTIATGYVDDIIRKFHRDEYEAWKRSLEENVPGVPAAIEPDEVTESTIEPEEDEA